MPINVGFYSHFLVFASLLATSLAHQEVCAQDKSTQNVPTEAKRAENLPKDINDSFLNPDLYVDEFV